ncbi:MAG: hypothetical protein ACPL28_12420, partial [bacterium]
AGPGALRAVAVLEAGDAHPESISDLGFRNSEKRIPAHPVKSAIRNPQLKISPPHPLALDFLLISDIL